MRVRTALVEVRKPEGLEEVFDHAVERRLAWVFGTGEIHDDTDRVASKHNYQLWVPEAPEEGAAPEFWVAIREDLIASWDEVDDFDFISFQSTREGLGRIVLGNDMEHPFDDEKALVFFIEDGRLGAVDNEGRIKNSPSFASIDDPNYEYAEHVYSVSPIS